MGWRHVGVKGMGEILGLWCLRYSRVKIHEAGESHPGWYGELWSWQFSCCDVQQRKMAQTQPSSSVFDTKPESKSDGALSSSEQEGEWDVVEEARARRK